MIDDDPDNTSFKAEGHWDPTLPGGWRADIRLIALWEPVQL